MLPVARTASRSILRSNPLSFPACGATRLFHASSVRAALSESDHSEHDPDDRKAKIDHHKEDQLKRQQEGQGRWKKELSSNSEAAGWMLTLPFVWGGQIKADRDEVTHVEEDIAALQKETTEAMNEKSK
ncbi:MAG: hypothetical protein LQ342_000888 [Letrouitia transgressa]|nr:MAG: hypothetical protein LQ342_000888 [Letrouitia transgressa]